MQLGRARQTMRRSLAGLASPVSGSSIAGRRARARRNNRPSPSLCPRRALISPLPPLFVGRLASSVRRSGRAFGCFPFAALVFIRFIRDVSTERAKISFDAVAGRGGVLEGVVCVWVWVLWGRLGVAVGFVGTRSCWIWIGCYSKKSMFVLRGMLR